MSTAVLIDGAYFVKRFRHIEPHHAYDAHRAAELAFRCALSHLAQGPSKAENGRSGEPKKKHDLYRIFFYDCPPLEKKLHNPISKKSIDFAQSQEAVFRQSLHNLLKVKRKVALRLGHLASDTPWTIKPRVIEELLK